MSLRFFSPRVGVGVAFLAVLGAGLVAFDARATAKAKPIRAREVQLKLIGTFDSPDFVVSPPGDARRLFVVEKVGRVRVIVAGQRQPAPFLDIASGVSKGNEPGLLSLAFSPRYAEDGLLYVYYAGTDERTHLLEFRRSTSNPNKADPSTRREVLSLAHPSGEHFGGLLLFGPDGKLYLGTGDGGMNEWQDKMRAQRLNDPNGKIIRVNTSTGATRVVARGLRNPWRYTIDPATGDFYIGDVGEFVRESIKYAPRAKAQGTNFGWPCFEGALPSTKFPASMCPKSVPPLLEYAREGGNCAVIGGVVVHDPRLPALAGRYLYADYCLGEINVLQVKNGRLATKRSLHIYEPGLESFGTDALKRVYIALASGAVYRLDPANTGGTSKNLAAPTTGKEIFLASGCGSCHTLSAANTAGTYGPNLDQAKPSRSLVVQRVTWGKDLMPSFKGRLTTKQISTVADFVSKR